jgi:hypothetical protein
MAVRGSVGDVDRFQFYDHMKAYTAAPPDVLRVDEKNLREYSVQNCVGVIITSNRKTDGIYLPADDRRHYVAWSDLAKEDFETDYWNKLYGWYRDGGDRHVAAYLASLDLASFDPKAPPPKTQTFWEIVDASRAIAEAVQRPTMKFVPNGAKSFAPIIDDPDAPDPKAPKWFGYIGSSTTYRPIPRACPRTQARQGCPRRVTRTQ